MNMYKEGLKAGLLLMQTIGFYVNHHIVSLYVCSVATIIIYSR